MMTKKCEMAEWILDFFRRTKADASQIVMMRSIQNKLHELNPKEREMFVPVANELIAHGYFTYEEGALQVLRLTEKGRDYIYNPDAELDCCNDDRRLTPAQVRYVSCLHDSFMKFVTQGLNILAVLKDAAGATEKDKDGFERCRQVLAGTEVGEVERSLGNGIISKAILDKIEHIHKELLDTALANIQTDTLSKEFFARLSYLRVEQDRKAEESRLGAMRIPLGQ